MIIYSKVFKLTERTQNCIWNHQGEITQKVWKQELPFLYMTHPQDLFYITVKYHDNIPKSIQVMEWTQNCIWNHQGEITQKVWKQELPFLYRTHRQDLVYITVKYHDNIPKSIQVMEWTQNCIWNHQGEIIQKVWKKELPFLYRTHCQDLFNITVKYHDNIPKSIQVMEQTRNCIWNNQGEITQKVWKQELSFLYMSHRHDLFNITVKCHDNIPKGIQPSYGADTKLHLKQSRGNNSKSKKARVVILVHDTSSWSGLNNCEVSRLYSEGYASYRADTNIHKKASKGR